MSYAAHVVMLAAMALMPWHWFMVVPDLVWIGIFAAIALGYAVLTLARPNVAVGPCAGHHGHRLVAWYHVTMMLGMVWMVVLMPYLPSAGHHGAVPIEAGQLPGHVAAPPLDGAGLHAHGAVVLSTAGVDVPPLWNLSLWMTALTYLFAAVFLVATVRFLAQLRVAPRGIRRGEALPARAELIISAAIAAGMGISYFVMT